MKKIVSFILTLICVSCFAICASAQESESGLIVDEINLFSEKEFSTIEKRLENVSEKYDSDVLIYITDYPRGNSLDFAHDMRDRYLKKTGGKDAILLMIAVNSRDYAFSTLGECEDAFNNSNFDKIEDAVVEKLSQNDFYNACLTYISYCDLIIPKADHNVKMKKLRFSGISLLIGVVVAFIVCMIYKKQLKSVSMGKNANDFVRRGSFALTTSNDLFLYKNVSKVKRQSSSSSGGHSSGGHRGGGRSGKF